MEYFSFRCFFLILYSSDSLVVGSSTSFGKTCSVILCHGDGAMTNVHIPHNHKLYQPFVLSFFSFYVTFSQVFLLFYSSYIFFSTAITTLALNWFSSFYSVFSSHFGDTHLPERAITKPTCEDFFCWYALFYTQFVYSVLFFKFTFLFVILCLWCK